jgi:hypothetical protein
MKRSSYRPYIFKDKITIRICALAGGSDPRVECETRAAGVMIGKNLFDYFIFKNIQA